MARSNRPARPPLTVQIRIGDELAQRFVKLRDELRVSGATVVKLALREYLNRIDVER